MQPIKKNLFLYFLSTFGKSNLTHLTKDVLFSGQRFAILAKFFGEVAQFSHLLTRVPDFFLCGEVACFFYGGRMIFCVEVTKNFGGCRIFCVVRLRDFLCGEVA